MSKNTIKFKCKCGKPMEISKDFTLAGLAAEEWIECIVCVECFDKCTEEAMEEHEYSERDS